MENIIYCIFLFITVPMLLMIGFTEKKQKATIAFMVTGIAVSLVSSEVNTVLLQATGFDFFYFTVSVSPIVEEVLKAIPLLYVVFFFAEDLKKEKVVTWGFGAGVGFAIFENIVVFFQNDAQTDLFSAFTRVIGASLVHSLCTGFVGLGLCVIKEFKKPYIYGIVSIISLAAIYHGTYNCMIQSEIFNPFGICFPLITYVLLYLLYRRLGNRNPKPYLSENNNREEPK